MGSRHGQVARHDPSGGHHRRIGRVTADEVNLDRLHNRVRKEGNRIKLDFGCLTNCFFPNSDVDTGNSKIH